MDTKIEEVIFEGGNNSNDLMEQFLSSGYIFNRNTLDMERFLDEDKTIDLEKLELAIALTIENLKKSVKIEKPIYVFLGNMDGYMRLRGLDLNKDIDRIIEESSFILGFCQAIADEESDEEIMVRFRGKDA